MSDAGDSVFDDPNALDPGTRFGELEIVRTLGVGGFGIVYLAKDHALERTVAVKEYMPAQLAQRSQSSQVSVRSAQHKDTFELGLRSFVNEARLLARFDHKSLLKVYRFWEANGTAYMVMPYLQGKTLKRIREGLVDSPSEAWILKQVMPLLDALELLHGEQVYHRDISPDNILLPPDGGDPILLDFGAARRVIGDRTQTFTAIFKPSYAPIEQYGETTQLRQGAWTDIYSLGAVMHFLLTGSPPPLATTRAVIDEFEPLAQRQDWPNHSRHFRAAIDWALAVRPSERPHNVGELRDALMGDRTMPLVVRPGPAPAPVDEDADMVTLPPIARVKPGPFEATQMIAAPKPTVEQMVVNALGRTQPLDRNAPHERTQPLTPEDSAASASATAAAPPAARPRPERARRAAPERSPAPAAPLNRQRLMLGLGAGAAILVLASFWWVLQDRGPAAGESSGLVVSIGAASAVPMAAPAASALPDAGASAPTPLASQPAPGPVSVVAGGLAAPAASSAPAASPPPTKLPVAGAGVTPGGATATPATRPPRRTEPVVVAATPARVEAHSSPAAPAPAPVSNPVRSGPLDPRSACGDRVFIAMWRCIEQRCEEPGYSEHTECENLRARREQRQGLRNR